MAKYIDRDLALSFPYGRGEYDHKNANPHFIFGCETYREWIEGLPTADVAPVIHAHWEDIIVLSSVTHYRKCSACGVCVEWDKKPFLFGNGKYNYCPNCGAKMDKEVNDA